jgi:hypothetical protein
MKPKSQSIEVAHTSGQRSLMQFGQVPPNAWKISGKTLTLDELIDNDRQDIVSADLQVLRTSTDRLLDKLKESNAVGHAGLVETVYIIVEVLESPSVELAKDPLPIWLAEVGFAASYLLKRFDLIPDHVPEIGLADDALILQRVIERNRSALDRWRAGENYDRKTD